jgi:pantoate kinase
MLGCHIDDMKASAFSPAHITGIFRIYKNGSAGAGINLDKGMETTIFAEEGKGTKIRINGKEENAKTSRVVVRKFREITGYTKRIVVEHAAALPIGYGLGMSGAGALSLSLALNRALGAGLKREECMRVAHDAEIECGTGLGSVDAESIGGFVTRRKAGARNARRIRLGKSEKGLLVVCGFFSPMSTKSVIRSRGWKEKINAVGEKCLEEFWSSPYLENFLSASRRFTIETGLGRWCGRIMKEEKRTSMAMLGKTIFTITDKPDDAVKEYGKYAKNVSVLRIGKKGAHML